MEIHCTRDHELISRWGGQCGCGWTRRKAMRWARLADPTHVVITDGSAEAEAALMRERIHADGMLNRGCL